MGEYRKSSWCSANSCVEVADLDDGGVMMRDASGRELKIDAVSWRELKASAEVVNLRDE